MRGFHGKDLHACSCKYHAWDRGEDPKVSDVYRFSNTLLFIDSGPEFIALMFKESKQMRQF
ncbi:hypothetical protein NC653_014955 [Populus alba x Populus x berolinensis]|uniref:Uncharacterized protein n=1 Tax=Populus alba x Populus x berolinensis TaxID=444605 RepID=A0AAD6W4E3_9ROSI|nr:hypothetical protein NC653_014950 [Populus alba x Populus x berolinensis]KAJ6998966.1 hypothetical protein NC653_014955 [Populus alba x Populus x berolinensis]